MLICILRFFDQHSHHNQWADQEQQGEVGEGCQGRGQPLLGAQGGVGQDQGALRQLEMRVKQINLCMFEHNLFSST